MEATPNAVKRAPLTKNISLTSSRPRFTVRRSAGLLLALVGLTLTVSASQNVRSRPRAPEFSAISDHATAERLTEGLKTVSGRRQAPSGDYRLATAEAFTLHVRAAGGRVAAFAVVDPEGQPVTARPDTGRASALARPSPTIGPPRGQYCVTFIVRSCAGWEFNDLSAPVCTGGWVERPVTFCWGLPPSPKKQ
jgi:hypothetical protein